METQFRPEDLLTFAELELLPQLNSPNKVAKLLYKKLGLYVVPQDCIVYVLDSITASYVKIGDIKSMNRIISVLTQYISDSFDNLSEKDQDHLQIKLKKDLKYIMSNTFISSALPQIQDEIFKHDTANKKFGPEIGKMHFKNGYINLADGSFNQRIIGTDYVKYVINRNYTKSSEAQREKVLSVFKKIYPLSEDLNAILSVFGSALTGLATSEQKILVLLGPGASGKSSIMRLTELAIGEYFMEISNDALCESNKQRDKTMATFYLSSQIRIIWVNEPKEKKMDPPTVKQIAEGRLKGKLLYKDGDYTFQHYGLVIITTNTMISIKLDSGILRRLCGYEHTSLFTPFKDKVNEEENIYLSEKDIHDRLAELGLLDAWIDILCVYSQKYLAKIPLPIPDSFISCTEDMTQSNDKIQDLIDAKLIVTNDDNDKIGKIEMLEIYTDFTQSHLTLHQLMSLMKTKNIKYDKEVRSKGIKGCYIGIKLRPDNYDFEEEEKHEQENESYREQFNRSQYRVKELEQLLKENGIVENNEDVILPTKKQKKTCTVTVDMDDCQDDYILNFHMKLKKGLNPMDSDDDDDDEYDPFESDDEDEYEYEEEVKLKHTSKPKVNSSKIKSNETSLSKKLHNALFV